jgi:hypothetical protein
MVARFTDHKIVVLLIAIIWLLQLCALILPDGRIWGMNALKFLPIWLKIAYLTLGILALAIFFHPLWKTTIRAFDGAGSFFFERQNTIKWFICSLFVTFIFWLFRIPTLLLGDGPTCVANISSFAPCFRWTEWGTIFTVYSVSRILPYHGVVSGDIAYRIVSIVSGGFTIYLFFKLAFKLGRHKHESFLIFVLLLFAGWILLFFGYVENYPILWPFIAAYIYNAIRFLKGESSIGIPILFLLVAIVLHVQIIFFAISILPLIFARGQLRKIYNTQKMKVLYIIVSLFALGCAVFIWLYIAFGTFRFYFVPVFSGRLPVTNYTLFSLPHIMDMGNLIFMLTPLLPVLICIAAIRTRPFTCDIIDCFLLLFSIGGFALLFLIDPGLGMGRDWDLFALSGLGPLLFMIRKIPISCIINIAPSLAFAAPILIMPILIVNLTWQPSIDRAKMLLSLDILRSRSGIKLLSLAYAKSRNYDVVDSLETVLRANFPSYAGVPRAYHLLGEKKFEAARNLADSLILMEPYSAELFMLRSMIYLQQDSISQAVHDAETGYQLGKNNAQILINLSTMYQAAGKIDGLKELQRDVSVTDSKSIFIQQGRSLGFIASRSYDSALVYAARIIRTDSNYPEAYVAAGYAAFMLGDTTAARSYLKRCLELNPEEPTYSNAVSIMKKIR